MQGGGSPQELDMCRASICKGFNLKAKLKSAWFIIEHPAPHPLPPPTPTLQPPQPLPSPPPPLPTNYPVPARPPQLPRQSASLSLSCSRELGKRGHRCTSANRYSMVVHCAISYCTALRCTALHCTALNCTALRCAALHCTALRGTALACKTPFYDIILLSLMNGRQKTARIPYWPLRQFDFYENLFKIGLFVRRINSWLSSKHWYIPFETVQGPTSILHISCLFEGNLGC